MAHQRRRHDDRGGWRLRVIHAETTRRRAGFDEVLWIVDRM
jgi:hypothetical protein